MMSSAMHYPMVHAHSMPTTAHHLGRLRASSHLSAQQPPVHASRSSTSHPATRFRADSDPSPTTSSNSRCSSSPDTMSGENPSETLPSGAIRCWSHGCNGREFSSLGNYRRHFREQHRVCKKFSCQRCGRTFSRSTARNVHFEKRKCRAVRVASEDNHSSCSPSSLPSPSLHDSFIEPFSSPAMTHYELSPALSRNASLDSIFPYQPQTPTDELLSMSPMDSLYDFDTKASQSPMSDYDATQWGMWDESLILGEPALSWEDWNQPMLAGTCGFVDNTISSSNNSSCMPQALLDLQWMPR